MEINMYKNTICDMIKRNESDVWDVVFEILPKQCSNSFVSYCFEHCQIFQNSVSILSNCNRVCIKVKHFRVLRMWWKKKENEIFDK